MKLGVTLPLIDVGGEPDTARRFAETAEKLGYDHLALPPGEEARAEFAKLKGFAKEAGRDPGQIGIEVWTSAVGEPAQWRDEVKAWQDHGVTHVTLNNCFGRYHHSRIPGRTLADHMSAMERYREAVAPALA